MLLVLAVVFEKDTVKLLDGIFCDRYGLETLEDHAHRIGISGHFCSSRLANDFVFTGRREAEWVRHGTRPSSIALVRCGR